MAGPAGPLGWQADWVCYASSLGCCCRALSSEWNVNWRKRVARARQMLARRWANIQHALIVIQFLDAPSPDVRRSRRPHAVRTNRHTAPDSERGRLVHGGGGARAVAGSRELLRVMIDDFRHTRTPGCPSRGLRGATSAPS